MNNPTSYFFCGVGGSGMLPLAMILRGRGVEVSGSDRARDQGRLAEKFDYLQSIGIRLFAQDGSGVQDAEQIVVASAAVEDTVPDIAAAIRVGAKRMTRAQLLAELFNASPASIAVGGTSGKSTTTAMIGWICDEARLAPTVMNGAVMNNYVSDDALFASAIVGGDELFVSEVDESDGSIALYQPTIAVLNNVSHDHKSMEELRALFGDFLAKAEVAVVNLDNDEVCALRDRAGAFLNYSLVDEAADFYADEITPMRDGVQFRVSRKAGGDGRIHLRMPGRHNVANALAALCASEAAGVEFEKACASLESFKGVKRRFEIVGEAAGVTVIDDFGHNPDKIAATLKTLHDFPGRLLVMFQPHGFGPLRKMKDDFISCFAENLTGEDQLFMPQPVYFGGTVDRSVTSSDIAAGVCALGRQAVALDDRPACGEAILQAAREGDRIIVMGARDDTLSIFARELLVSLSER